MSSTTTSSAPMGYWEIVELTIKRLDLGQRFGSYEQAKQVAVETVKLAMQAHDKTSNFGQLEPDTMMTIVNDFVLRGAEAFKRKQTQRAEEQNQAAAAGISEKMLAEWKHKTMLCSDFAANSQCPEGAMAMPRGCVSVG